MKQFLRIWARQTTKGAISLDTAAVTTARGSAQGRYSERREATNNAAYGQARLR